MSLTWKRRMTTKGWNDPLTVPIILTVNWNDLLLSTTTEKSALHSLRQHTHTRNRSSRQEADSILEDISSGAPFLKGKRGRRVCVHTSAVVFPLAHWAYQAKACLNWICVGKEAALTRAGIILGCCSCAFLPPPGASGWKAGLVLQEHFPWTFYLRVDLLQLLQRQAALVDVVFVFFFVFLSRSIICQDLSNVVLQTQTKRTASRPGCAQRRSASQS